MGLETGIIKGNKTKYYNKTDDKEVVKYSKYVNLGVNSCFNIDDDVVVISKKEYDDLTATNGNETEIIKELNNLIDDKDNKITNLTDKMAELNREIGNINNTNTNNANKIADLTTELKAVELELTELKTIMKQYNITHADELGNLIAEFRVILNYLSDCIVAYETQGRFKRFLKKTPTLDIVKQPTKLIDYRGNPYINNGNDIFTNKVVDSKE